MNRYDTINCICFIAQNRCLRIKLFCRKVQPEKKVSINKNQRFREIFKENFLCSNCSKFGIMQDLFEMIKKRLDSKKERLFEWLATNTEE